eukprot:4029629-Pyramimonas_sp.AAC.1
MEAADGTVTTATTTGAQMGFTLCPRQFDDSYNIYVGKWNDLLREDPNQKPHDTFHPITGVRHDLAIYTFMDDITHKNHTIPNNSTPQEIISQINEATTKLTDTIKVGGWFLNNGKTNHPLDLKGRGSYARTRRI